MSKFWRLSKMMALVGAGGMLWLAGAGSCLPFNFYSGLLGNTIISTIVGAVSGAVGNSLAT